ncbi:hypothetical protein GJ688_11855 [Heliobacillus mobilis]|uniref:Uncharacterized protein n=1 Tax=Heliobacterium mobile TaxID=28064 RepID=A0A6I3SL76_HELMO|nr:hypothetical protein [Heliobacterium mobile]MTV49669.1 hypothetical protein [Heliobacterium mobile]
MDNRNRDPFSLSGAYWNQRHVLRSFSEKLHQMGQTVNSKECLDTYQWAQIMAVALEYQPDVILELGRAYGNSTCVFVEASQRLEKTCDVVSICMTDYFQKQTIPALKDKGLIDDDWLSPLQCHTADILQFPFEELLAGQQRVLLFWDAHGFEVANVVLGKIMPVLASRDHLVIMHDLSDARYCGEHIFPYGETSLWDGENAGDNRFFIGHVSSAVGQAISALDFLTRNRIELYSADHVFHTEIGADDDKIKTMRESLGDLFSLNAHWYCFSMNTADGPFTFPNIATFQRSKRIIEGLYGITSPDEHLALQAKQARFRERWNERLQGRKLAIFGCGVAGKKLRDYLRELTIPVGAFFDNNQNRWGSEVDGIPLCAPAEIDASWFVIIASQWQQEIAAQLLSMGLQQGIHFAENYDDWVQLVIADGGR